MFNSKARHWLIAALALLACALATPASAINCNVANGTCFVINGGGNSSVAGTWANTAGQTTGGAGPPTTTSNVILDSSAGNLTINANLSVGTFDASGTGGSGSPYVGTLSQAAAATLTINTAAANSLLFSSGMTYTPNTNAATTVIFANTSGTAQITSAGKNFTAITVNGVGGTVQQQDNINITNAANIAAGSLTITNGTWDANGGAGCPCTITASGVNFANSNTRGLILGGTVTIGGASIATGTSIWNASTAGTLTFTKNSANIVVAPMSPAVQGAVFLGGAVPGGYNALTLNNNTGANQTLNIQSSNSFSTITVGSGWNFLLTSATTQTLSGALTINGTSANFSALQVLAAASAVTISAVGTCTATWTVLYGVTGAGTCTYTATNSINLGTNSGWSITPPSFGGGGGFIGIIGG